MAGRAALLLLALTLGGVARADSARITGVLERVRADRIAADVADLAALGTRFALLPSFEHAATLVRERLAQTGLPTVVDPFLVDTTSVKNVGVVLSGSVAERPPLWIIAHYDSYSSQLQLGAPGAEDNASGVAALLELGRVLAAERLATEVRLIAVAGEEEGAWGSRHLVQQIADGACLAPQAVINLDMIGYDPHHRRQVLLDTVPLGRALAARFASAASRFTVLEPSAGLFTTGRSDHAPFLQLGIPAVSVSDADAEAYPGYHTPSDLPANVDAQMIAEVTRATAALVLLLGGFADGPPVAHGGEFAVTTAGALVRLSGEQSFDPQRLPLRYSWSQIDGPELSPDTTDAWLSFTPSVAAGYRFQLVVSTPDGRRSEPDVAAAIVRDSGGCAVGQHPLAAGPEPWFLLALLLIAMGWQRLSP